MTGDRLTRFDGAPPLWRCPITFQLFPSREQQEQSTSKLVEQQGEGLTLAERRNLFLAASAAL